MNWIKTMNELDIAAWERELNHAQVMQEQRVSKQRPDVISATYDTPKNTYEIKDNDNEIN